ncbi:MarR family winged helix-turn-helix transcriptional regulator [Holdemania filiformis]|uniref:Transcriptional regulator, MarR family n=1 Tax=Holdemania filiformis DSM 12042 TaxID=545696 RepID=B9Y7S6_9FIRM|nr:MarR family transcriptional regulator [Holdemania filiformis]EEF67973.1 transcriptional regulator, MarR family [Holdemania filiformis DSM 12042]
MNRVRETVNGLLVEVFNHILFIEEQYMKHQGVTLSMTEVHILENVEKSETKTLGDVARLQMVTPGTLSVAVNSLVRKGYIMKCKDLQDKRVVRLLLSAKANECCGFIISSMKKWSTAASLIWSWKKRKS